MTTRYALDAADGLPEVIAAVTNGVSTQYLQTMGEFLAQADANGWSYPLPDGLGSARQIANAQGRLFREQRYDPYGNVLVSQGFGGTIFGYTGEQVDPTGLVFLRARYYNPAIGVFLSKDTWPGDLLRSQSMNGWSYVEGNPVNRTDPSGHCIVQWSGEVRMGQYPYGTSGLCPHTESAGTDASHSVTEVANTPGYGNDPTRIPAVIALAGIIAAPGTVAALAPTVYSASASCLTNPLCAAIVYGVGNQAANNVNASIPDGCKGFPMGVAPGTNQGTWINGVWYTGHALDQMQGRGFVPSVVENTIAIGQKWPGKYPDTTIYYDAVNNISVVVNQAGYIITVSYGKLLGQ